MAKIFRGKDTTLLYSQLKIFFDRVSIAKPASSRISSIEAFVVCQHYNPPVGYVPQMINPMSADAIRIVESAEPGVDMSVNRLVVPFVVCGDLNGFDADMSYDLDLDPKTGEPYDYKYHEVVQLPIAPAYKNVLEKTKSVSLRHTALVIDESADNENNTNTAT